MKQRYDRMIPLSIRVAPIDGRRFREMAQGLQKEWLRVVSDRQKFAAVTPRMFQPKGQTDLETVLTVSTIGPTGLPQEEAFYPPMATTDGEQMNTLYDYVIRMTKASLLHMPIFSTRIPLASSGFGV